MDSQGELSASTRLPKKQTKEVFTKNVLYERNTKTKSAAVGGSENLE